MKVIEKCLNELTLILMMQRRSKNNRKTELNRKILQVNNLGEDDQDNYWQKTTAWERLNGIEINRSFVYGYNPEYSPRLQRVLEVTGRKTS